MVYVFELIVKGVFIPNVTGIFSDGVNHLSINLILMSQDYRICSEEENFQFPKITKYPVRSIVLRKIDGWFWGNCPKTIRLFLCK